MSIVIDTIVKYWVQFAMGALVGAFAMLWRRVKKDRAEQKAIKNGMQALLRDRIIQAYNHYLREGACPIYARQNVLALYDAYHALGGNGTVTDLIHKLQNMPTESQI